MYSVSQSNLTLMLRHWLIVYSPALAEQPLKPIFIVTHDAHLQSSTNTMSPSQDLLIDVRSPVEFATGPLTSDIAPTVNIEYQIIDQLAEIYAARGININKDDNITLYCRSGRRSNIALQTLKNMGYERVRDIGGFEAARAVLDREQVQRQLDAEMESMPGIGSQSKIEDDKKEEDPKRHTRAKSFGALVEGLKALEE